MEFIALANHRKAICAEIAESSRRFRRVQLDTLSTVLEGYGVDPLRWPPASVIVILSGISRFLLIEEAFDIDIGHDETMAMVEDHIRSLEGERAGGGVKPARKAKRKSAAGPARRPRAATR
jgi:hypothetical protein